MHTQRHNALLGTYLELFPVFAPCDGGHGVATGVTFHAHGAALHDGELLLHQAAGDARGDCGQENRTCIVEREG